MGCCGVRHPTLSSFGNKNLIYREKMSRNLLRPTKVMYIRTGITLLGTTVGGIRLLCSYYFLILSARRVSPQYSYEYNEMGILESCELCKAGIAKR